MIGKYFLSNKVVEYRIRELPTSLPKKTKALVLYSMYSTKNMDVLTWPS